MTDLLPLEAYVLEYRRQMGRVRKMLIAAAAAFFVLAVVLTALGLGIGPSLGVPGAFLLLFGLLFPPMMLGQMVRVAAASLQHPPPDACQDAQRRLACWHGDGFSPSPSVLYFGPERMTLVRFNSVGTTVKEIRDLGTMVGTRYDAVPGAAGSPNVFKRLPALQMSWRGWITVVKVPCADTLATELNGQSQPT